MRSAPRRPGERSTSRVEPRWRRGRRTTDGPTIPVPKTDVRGPGDENIRKEAAAMHVTVRRYAEFGARMYEMAFRKVEAGLVPMLRASPASGATAPS